MNKTYIPALAAVSLLAILHFIATEYHLYTRYPGYDIMMHVLGGLGIAFAVYWTLVTFVPRYAVSFWTIVVWTFIAGFAWEAMETMYNIAGAPVGTRAYYIDSVKDLVNDTLGAIIAAFFLRK